MPDGQSNLPTSIAPVHFALALCDWIGLRSSSLEAPDVLGDAGWKAKTETSNVYRPDDFRNRRKPRRVSVSGVGIALLALSASGCSQPELPVYPVSGSVLFEGRSPLGARVVLHSLSGEPHVRPQGEVGFAGDFRLSSYAADDGAPVGDYVVTITWHEPIIDGEDYKPGPNTLPAQYAHPETSPLRVSVSNGANELPTILLSYCDERFPAQEALSQFP